MPKDEKNIRKYPRVAASIPCTIHILAPAETFSPYNFEARIHDLSEQGIGLTVPRMPKSVYSVLMRGIQYARIRASLPGCDGQSRIFGRIRWIEYHSATGNPFCRLGLSTEQNEQGVYEQMRGAIEVLSSEESSTAVALGPNSPDFAGVGVALAKEALEERVAISGPKWPENRQTG